MLQNRVSLKLRWNFVFCQPPQEKQKSESTNSICIPQNYLNEYDLWPLNSTCGVWWCQTLWAFQQNENEFFLHWKSCCTLSVNIMYHVHNDTRKKRHLSLLLLRVFFKYVFIISPCPFRMWKMFSQINVSWTFIHRGSSAMLLWNSSWNFNLPD